MILNESQVDFFTNESSNFWNHFNVFLRTWENFRIVSHNEILLFVLKKIIAEANSCLPQGTEPHKFQSSKIQI